MKFARGCSTHFGDHRRGGYARENRSAPSLNGEFAPLSTTTLQSGEANESPRRSPGRPRDPAVDAAVRAAVRQSLIEDGFEATTIPSIARRTGIGAPTIYRRWPTQIELVEAIFDDLFSGRQLEVPADEGDFRQLIREVAEGAFFFHGHPAARRA